MNSPISTALTVVSADIPKKSAPSRIAALDGLRGVAAIVVVFHHLFLVAQPFVRQQGGSAIGSPYWWVSQTPLKLATAGNEAVLVFFVLSGLVVSLPALKPGNFSWSAFLSGRLVRLYLPVWASIALGTVLVWAIPRNDSAVRDGTWMDNAQATSTTWPTILSQASLTRVSYDLNNVLWSLRWELLFSVLLPVFIALALVTARYWLVAVAVALGLSTVGLVEQIDALRYLPVFFIGTLMAVRLDAISEWMQARTQRPRSVLWAAALTIGALLLLVCQWLVRPIIPAATFANSLVAQLSVVGAVGLVLVAIGVPTVRSLLESRVSQWLGRVSFSLYLIHVPIVATLTFLLGDSRWWLVALLTTPVALLVAWGFNHAVERPSHRLARYITRSVSNRLDAHRAKSAIA